MDDINKKREGYAIVPSYVHESSIEEIVPGYTPDMVIKLLGDIDNMTQHPEIVGKDEDGLIVEWYYPNVILTFVYSNVGNTHSYVVYKIEVKE